MATIVVEITGIPGESTVSGYENMLDAIGIRETIDVAVPQGVGSGGGMGRARHSNVELLRYKDVASPKLAQACSAAEALKDVKIHVFRTLDSGAAVYMTYELGQVFVARIEHETLDEQGVAFLPRLVASQRNMPALAPAVGLASLASSFIAREATAVRAAVTPAFSLPRGRATNREVERVWLNASSISWTYTPYVSGMPGGAVQRGYNIMQSRPV